MTCPFCMEGEEDWINGDESFWPPWWTRFEECSCPECGITYNYVREMYQEFEENIPIFEKKKGVVFWNPKFGKSRTCWVFLRFGNTAQPFTVTAKSKKNAIIIAKSMCADNRADEWAVTLDGVKIGGGKR